jgi:hypothetical protein
MKHPLPLKSFKRIIFHKDKEWNGKSRNSSVNASSAPKSRVVPGLLDLPIEIIKDIVDLCDSREMLALCLTSKDLYTLTMPVLYSTFEPSQWMHVNRMDDFLANTSTHLCGWNRQEIVQRIAKSVTSINLLLPLVYKDDYEDARNRYVEKADKESQGLTGILGKASNLR